MPRTKGSKSKSGVPMKGLQEAVVLTKMAYDKHGDKSMSFSEIAESMKLPKGISTPIMGALSEYGLVEKSDLGWRISAEGKNAIFGDIDATRKCFTKISLFADLYHRFGSKAVTSGIIETYLRGKYRKGENVALIIKRFSEGLDYVKGLESGHTISGNVVIGTELNYSRDIALLKLKYALDPPTRDEIHKLIDIVEHELKNEDSSIVKLIKSIKENKDKKEVAKVLFDNLISILGDKYPFLITETKTAKNEDEG